MRFTTMWVPITGLVTGLLLSTALVGLGQGQVPAPRPDPERHPHIRAAMADLRKAVAQLERADHDFGGHRAKAVELAKQAEAELREALQWARAHPDSTATPASTQSKK